MKPKNKSVALWIAVFFAAVFFPSLRAQAECAELSRELIVGIKEAPPFSLKDEKGDWMGISVELWRRIATELCIRYRFVEVDDVGSLLRGVNAGDFDLAVAAIMITPSRARDVDFTFPYLRIGTGVAVRADPTASWRPVIRSIGSYGFLQAVSALLALSFLTGLLIWLCERRTNDGFGGGTSRGISAAIWWSTTAMTQRIGGGVVPVTVPGRVLALIWMIVSVIAVAVFTAGLTSALTSRRLQGVVTRVADLTAMRVGVVAGTVAQERVSHLRICFQVLPNVQRGLAALQNGRLDALVHDRPILAWLIRRNDAKAIELVDVTFAPQDCAIALRNGSGLKKRVDLALLEARDPDWWRENLARYMGWTGEEP